MILALLQFASDAGTDGPAALLADPEVAAAVDALMKADGAGPLVTLGLVLFLVNLIIRKGGLKYLPAGKVTDFLKTRGGGWALNGVLALLGAGGTLLKAGGPISLSTLGSALAKSVLTAAVAVMVNELQKDTAAAKEAGAKAADDPGPTVNS